ncbi:hypothetical protein RCH09_002806 [Actimicrobium sp. GrIS 1.19]|uniref:hypothetical protein n=1 Tax=Actimicrobium sp. GrIS 1.19 TaxID=3071708 RepID=UPI002DFE69C1|nr:hypothetical protein [Actimicrobium sp. GrIS 1.19]
MLSLARPALLAMLLVAGVADAAGAGFDIGIIAPTARAAGEDSAVRRAIAESDEDNLAFVVVNGIKSAEEGCDDALYLERKLLFDAAKNGVIVALNGDDWVDCKNAAGRSIAAERLNRLRELLYVDDFSFGGSKIPVSRQSNTAKFRTYTENMRWEFGPILFATVNLPAANNHYLQAAGRNNEFEDRLIANHDWLQRLMTIASRRKLEGLVLFCDGNPMTPPQAQYRRDGFAEIRAQLRQLATHFSGRILIVHQGLQHDPDHVDGIRWRGNLGTVAVTPGWMRLHVEPGTPGLFQLNALETTDSGRSNGKKKPQP